MLPKNYSQNNNNQKSDKKETAGVILIIVFSFLLFCNLLGPLVLGGIGSAIKNVSMGLIGFFSYPTYLYFLILGVFMLQGKKSTVKKKYAVALVLLFVSIVMIIQLATTSGYLYSFNNYVDYAYHKETIGGLIFGLIVYGLSSLLTTVGAYVVLGFLIAGALLLVAGFFDKFFASNVKKRKIVKNKDLASSVDKNKTFKSETPKLFIDTISTSSEQNFSAGMNFDSLPNERTFAPGAMNNNDYSRNAALEAGVTAMRQEQDEAYEELKRKADARKILFGDTEEYKKEAFGDSGVASSSPKTTYSSSAFDGYGSSFTSYYGTGSSSSSSRSSAYSSSLSDIVPIPPEKSVDYNYFGSAIINGDSVKAKESAEASAPRASFSMDDIKNTISTETFGYNSEYNERFINNSTTPEPEPVRPTLSRIINGDMVKKDGADFADDSATVEQIEGAKPEFPQFTPGPIIRGSTGTAIDLSPKAPEPVKQADLPVEQVATTVAQPTAKETYTAIDEVEEAEINEPTFNFTSPTSTDIKPEFVDESQFDTENYLEETVLTESDFASSQEIEAEIELDEEAYDIPVVNTNSTIENDIPDLPKEDEYDEIDEYSDMVEEDFEEDSVISDDFDFEDDEDETSGEEELNKYETAHGHPKFEGVSEKESQALNDRFEEVTSFKIEEEVIDQSANAKFNTPSAPEVKSAPVINVAPLVKTEPKPQVVSVANVSTPAVKEEPKPQEKPKRKKAYKYTRPTIDLLTTESSSSLVDTSTIEEKSRLLEDTLTNLGIDAKVESVTVGPAVTRYELNMPVGMSVRRIEGMQADIQYGLACPGKIRVESPIPGKRAVGVEVPNEKVALVALKDIIDSKEFNTATSPLTIALGKDIQGKVMTASIDKMPHLLIAGTTGSGKSACLNSLIISILFKASPDEVKLILVDPKCVEFSAYSGIPHMMIKDAITDSAQTLNAFKWLREEMDRRYKLLQNNRVRNIGEYNKLQSVKDGELDKLPYIVVIVDEFADLMLSSGAGNRRRELEGMISSIAGKARAAGIHMILATQRPSSDVITGTIKSNLPTCIAFAVSNSTNSRIILDKPGAEALVGKGDMLFAPQDRPDGIRIQGSFVDNPEINSIADFVRDNNVCEFDSEFENAIAVKEEVEEEDGDGEVSSGSEYDKDLVDIVKAVMVSGQASGAMIQRRFGIGYMRAAKIIDQMEELKFIGPSNGSKAREVFITKERYEEFFGVKFDD